jgi:hypothetical protein
MEQEANSIEQGISVRDALVGLARDAPLGRNLVPATAAGLETIRRFVIEHKIVTLPEREDLRVAETPVLPARSEQIGPLLSPSPK